MHLPYVYRIRVRAFEGGDWAGGFARGLLMLDGSPPKIWHLLQQMVQQKRIRKVQGALLARTHRGKRRKHAEEGEDEPQPKKRGRKAKEKNTVPEVPRRTARLRGADPEDADTGRRTRQKTASREMPSPASDGTWRRPHNLCAAKSRGGGALRTMPAELGFTNKRSDTGIQGGKPMNLMGGREPGIAGKVGRRHSRADGGGGMPRNLMERRGPGTAGKIGE
ncbi:hypothetical protein B0H19DRAFT_1076904 [Mycena capillaripes]|nr:hypothetical protein B0H19DRAFT_1076904 [Mycena capillaripes]